MKISSYFFIFVLLISFAILSWAGPQEEEMDVAKVRKAIEEANLKFREAVRKGDVATLVARYTEDATLLPDGSDMTKGRQGIEAFWNGSMQMGMKDIVLTIVDVFGSGDFAYEIGQATVKIQPEGQEPVEQKAKYVDVWKRMADGSWKMHVSIWNSSMPAQ